MLTARRLSENLNSQGYLSPVQHAHLGGVVTPAWHVCTQPLGVVHGIPSPHMHEDPLNIFAYQLDCCKISSCMRNTADVLLELQPLIQATAALSGCGQMNLLCPEIY